MDTPPLLSHADEAQPELNYAVELQQLAASVGFDWPNIEGIVDKIHEEIDEVKAEVNTPNNHARLLDEMGDLLFACTNLARHLNIDPEAALTAGNQKFYRRFSQLELIAKANKQDIKQLSLEELDSLWEQVKLDEK
ncbi:MAG: nucleotide pyrophosphohydrolase [Methylococcaceae bacterium]|nr:nucleotide pyrophosphohydrolase [Methylococcaceae bacterium]